MTSTTASRSKLSLLLLFITTAKKLAEAATNEVYAGANQGTYQNVYLTAPQTYYVPEAYHKYQKYVSVSENQIPSTSTGKTVLLPSYKATFDPSKYVTPQLTKTTPIDYGSQASYPYLYTVAKIVPSTGAGYSSSVVDTKSSHYEEVPKKYHYGYRVSDPHSGNEFGHSEVHDGHSARGYYHVLLPDGRLQNVKYWAGPSGYHATITYENKY